MSLHRKPTQYKLLIELNIYRLHSITCDPYYSRTDARTQKWNVFGKLYTVLKYRIYHASLLADTINSELSGPRVYVSKNKSTRKGESIVLRSTILKFSDIKIPEGPKLWILEFYKALLKMIGTMLHPYWAEYKPMVSSSGNNSVHSHSI